MMVKKYSILIFYLTIYSIGGHSQSTEVDHVNEIRISTLNERWNVDDTHLSEFQLGFQHTFESSAISTTFLHRGTKSFDINTIGVDYYHTLSGGYFHLSSYVNLNFEELSYRLLADVNYILPYDSELKLGIRLFYNQQSTIIYSIGLNHYTGPFYLSYSFNQVTGNGNYHTALLRYYLEKRIKTVEVSFGNSRILEDQGIFDLSSTRIMFSGEIILTNSISTTIGIGMGWRSTEASQAYQFSLVTGIKKNF